MRYGRVSRMLLRILVKIGLSPLPQPCDDPQHRFDFPRDTDDHSVVSDLDIPLSPEDLTPKAYL